MRWAWWPGTTWRSSTVGRPGTRCSPTSASTRRGRGRRRSSRCSRGSQHDCPSLTSKSKTLVEATRHSRLKWAKSASARNMVRNHAMSLFHLSHSSFLFLRTTGYCNSFPSRNVISSDSIDLFVFLSPLWIQLISSCCSWWPHRRWEPAATWLARLTKAQKVGFLAPEIWDFLRPEIFFRARSDLAAGKKLPRYQRLETWLRVWPWVCTLNLRNGYYPTIIT